MFRSSLKWWEGLDWLKGIEEKWPKPEADLNDEEIQRERRKTVASHLTFTKEKWYLKCFSSYFKIEEMTTILWDVKAVINSRPLTYMSKDPSNLEPLTPSLFIQDSKTVGYRQFRQNKPD
ncbi:hypothetical protein NPIL_212721 [Nephila pilipes]|uniref:Uncharacterized protein n=1 Tax=Nephila pilipes TaxID=299642 RepID=A0A8X6MHT7_NEPPI|nr:hypothetical protein NPIL_212721 [Nephila pilipes]